MKKITLLFCCIILTFSCISLQAQKPCLKNCKYNINIDLIDSVLCINLSLKATKAETGQKDFLLFNRYIQIKEAKLDNSPLEYTRSNDSLFFEASQKNDMTLSMQYEIPCSKTGYSKTVASYGDSIHDYPTLFDSSQIFCERFNKWYPVLYDNFSDYNVTISVPKKHKVFGYYPQTDYADIAEKDVYSFYCVDEDFPFLITQSNIFQQLKVIKHKTTNYDFYFLPRSKRLFAVVDEKPVFVSDSKQIDSLLNVTINRSIAAVEWYNANLWQQKIETLSFVETGILGLGVCLGSFIVMDRRLMNLEVFNNYAVSHEIAHLWLGIHTEYLAKGKFFLGESIPEYVNFLFYESWAGDGAMEKAFQAKRNLKLSEVPFYTVTFEQVLNQRKGSLQADDVIYYKGVAFVHEFRKMIGKEKLLKIIRETYSLPNHFVALTDFEKSIKANGCWEEYMELFDLKL